MNLDAYPFRMMITAKGGAVAYSPANSNPLNPVGLANHLSWEIVCPPAPISVSPSYNLGTTFQTYVGASGTAATYTFPPYIPELSKCSDVTAYSITQVSDPSMVTFPHPNCATDPCRQVLINTSSPGSVSFKI